MSLLPSRLVKYLTGRLLDLFLLGGLIWGSFAGQAVAQQITFKSYGEAEGLTNAYFSCLHQDRNGYVFACTEHGLYVYDGRRFLNFGSAQGLPDGGVVSGLVFDTANRLIVRYPHHIFVSTTPIGPGVPPVDLMFRAARSRVGPIPTDATGQIAPWPGGAVFAGNGSLFVVHSDTGADEAWVGPADTVSWHPADPLKDATSLAVQASVIWAVRADNAICGYDTRTVRCFGPSEGLPSDDWVALLVSADGHVLARSPTRLADIDPRNGHVDVSTLPAQGGRYANYPNKLLLAVGPSGQLMTQSADGLMMRTSSGWTMLGTANGLPSAAILALMFDRNGDLWLGVNGRGVMRTLGYGVWENFDHRDGLSSDMLWQLVRQPDGPLWVASDGGIDAIKAPAGVRLQQRHLDGAAFSIALDGFGHLWRSAGSSAVACVTLDTGATTTYPLPQVSQILRGKGPQLWFVTEKGLYTLDDSHTPTPPKPVAGLGRSVTAIAMAPDHSLWVVHDQELQHRHEDGRIVSAPLNWQQSDFEPLTLVVGRDEVVWLAGAGGGGLYRLQFHDDRLLSSTKFQPPNMISNSIVSLLIDSRGWLWAGTDRGISAFNGTRWVSANMDKGLIWNDQDQGGLLEDSDGSIWFATSKGLSHLLHPSSLFDPETLQPVIGSVTVGDVAYRQRAVRYTRESFLLQFSALDLSIDGIVRFRYRLDGVDNRWVDTASGYARYASVPPGHHRFELVAYDPLTSQISAPVSILLRMHSPWWFWWPLVAAYALATVGLIYGLMLLRVRLLMKQRQALQLEVDLRTAEIREAQITDGLTRLLTRGEIQARLVDILSRQKRSSHIAIGLLDIDHFKQVNDQFGHLVGDEVLKELGSRMKMALAPGEYAGRYGGEEILIVLGGTQSPQIERIHTLSRAVCGAPFHVEDQVIDVTCSVGFAHVRSGDDWKTLIGRTDRALYRAKAEGRNRIIVSSAGPESSWQPVVHTSHPGKRDLPDL